MASCGGWLAGGRRAAFKQAVQLLIQGLVVFPLPVIQLGQVVFQFVKALVQLVPQEVRMVTPTLAQTPSAVTIINSVWAIAGIGLAGE